MEGIFNNISVFDWRDRRNPCKTSSAEIESGYFTIQVRSTTAGAVLLTFFVIQNFIHVVIWVKKNKTDREFSRRMEDEQCMRNFSRLT